jgi:ADP-glucose pyrophosphorylase
VAGSVVLSDCRIGADASVHDAILAPGVEVGEGARIEAGAVVGEGAQIEDGAVIEGAARLDPGQVAS